MESISIKYQKLQRLCKEQSQSIQLSGSVPLLASNFPSTNVTHVHSGHMKTNEDSLFDRNDGGSTDAKPEFENVMHHQDSSTLKHFHYPIDNGEEVQFNLQPGGSLFSSSDSIDWDETTNASSANLEGIITEDLNPNMKPELSVPKDEKQNIGPRFLFKYNESIKTAAKRRLMHGKACPCCSKVLRMPNGQAIH